MKIHRHFWAEMVNQNSSKIGQLCSFSKRIVRQPVKLWRWFLHRWIHKNIPHQMTSEIFSYLEAGIGTSSSTYRSCRKFGFFGYSDVHCQAPNPLIITNEIFLERTSSPLHSLISYVIITVFVLMLHWSETDKIKIAQTSSQVSLLIKMASLWCKLFWT